MSLVVDESIAIFGYILADGSDVWVLVVVFGTFDN